MFALEFPSLRAARSFLRGYCVPRLIVTRGGVFGIVSPATARRRKYRFVGSNCGA
jgi:hypothetical protein